MNDRRRSRPERVFDEGLQHERTALAWERTAISMIVAGVLVARYAAESVHWSFAGPGLATVVFGCVLLVWSGQHYDDLHGPLRSGANPAHPAMARIVGLATVGLTAAALAMSVAIVASRR